MKSSSCFTQRLTSILGSGVTTSKLCVGTSTTSRQKSLSTWLATRALNVPLVVICSMQPKIPKRTSSWRKPIVRPCFVPTRLWGKHGCCTRREISQIWNQTTGTWSVSFTWGRFLEQMTSMSYSQPNIVWVNTRRSYLIVWWIITAWSRSGRRLGPH